MAWSSKYPIDDHHITPGMFASNRAKNEIFQLPTEKLVNLPFWPFNRILFGAPSRGVWSLWVNHIGWSSGAVKTPPHKQKNPSGSDRQEELFWEVFFFLVANFWGDKKKECQQKVVVVFVFFCLLFFWWMLNAFAVLMNNWSFNNFLSTIFFWVLILIYETFCHTKQDFRHNFSESLGLSSGVFGLSTFTTLGPPNFGSEIGSREIRKSPAFSSGKREVKYYSRNGQILRWAYFPPKFTGSRTWEMMAKEDDPFASFWGKT